MNGKLKILVILIILISCVGFASAAGADNSTCDDVMLAEDAPIDPGADNSTGGDVPASEDAGEANVTDNSTGGDVPASEDAGEVNATDNSTGGDMPASEDAGEANATDNSTVPQTPKISISSAKVYVGKSVDIYLKDSNNTPLKNQTLTTTINKQTKSFTTDSKGKISLKLDLTVSKYVLKVTFKGNQNFTGLTKTFNINVVKYKTYIKQQSVQIIAGNYFKIHLTGENGKSLTNTKVIFKINGKKYETKTNKNGYAGLKINLGVGKYSINAQYNGNKYYNPVSKTMSLIVPSKTSLTIGNSRLLTNGFLRIYLKSPTPSAVSKKTVTITVANKKFTKTTNTEGVIVFKPAAGKGSLVVKASFDGNIKIIGSSAKKTVKGIAGNVKNPFSQKIPLKNGMPDVDLMPASFVMANGDATYTLTKAQYLDVIKRDSYCLFLNNKLSKYTFFKTKKEPKINHIVKREKWNVIERAINTKVVLKNQYNYWPSEITVALKGKSYTYSEVRDEQDTGYTCGPTSASFCSQVLRHYVNEWHLGVQAGSDPNYGSSTSGLKKALEKNNFKCTFYYKSSFNNALKELKKGGCALIFHTWSHYVAILDISKDGKMVLVGNPSGDYNHGSHKIPTKWLSVNYMYGRFNNYDTSGLIVKLKYNLNKATKNKINNFYSSMGTKWTRQNTNERIPQL